jgi:hypothetical protein
MAFGDPFYGLEVVGPLKVYLSNVRDHPASRVQGAVLLRTVIISLLFTHATVLVDPGGILVTCLDATSDAGFSITLVNLLPHDTLTGL